MTLLRSAGLAAALTVAVATSALAAGPELNASYTALAMQGYDPGAYFTPGEATKGSYKITVAHNDATYWFTIEEHKAAFEENPGSFLPEHRGSYVLAPPWASSSRVTRTTGKSLTESCS